MATRHFDGADDEIRFAMGSVNMTYGTFGIIVRRTAAPTGLNGSALIALSGAGGVALQAIIDHLNKLYYKALAAGASVATVDKLNNWYVFLLGKANGPVRPKYHIYDYSLGTWAHDPGTGQVGNATSSAGGTIQVGEVGDQHDLNGDIAVGALWANKVFTDAEVEAMLLPNTIAAWDASLPSACWAFNQADTSEPVLDRSGHGANQTVCNGTSVSPDDPPGFVY